MGDKLFFTGSSELSYNELVRTINEEPFYYKAWLYPSVEKFFTNFLKALYYGKDITLLDADFSDQELKALGIGKGIGQKEEIAPNHIDDIHHLLHSIKNSKSTITIFTSGTTGLPKKVEHSVDSLTRMVRQGRKYEEDVWALAYNPTHMAGLQVFMQAVFNTNTIVNIFDQEIENIDYILENYQVSHISATPTFYRLSLTSETKLPSIKRVTLGGEKYDEKLKLKLEAKFPNAKINNIYASTEIGSLLVANGSTFNIPDHLSDVVKIENNELKVHHSLLATNKEASNEWYATGDVVEVVKNNPLQFRFLRRDSDLINVGGYKVNPIEVEEAIMKLKDVEAVRVFGKDNSVMGKILCAEVVSTNAIDSKEIRIALINYLQDFKIPRIIKKVDFLQSTRTGKIKR